MDDFNELNKRLSDKEREPMADAVVRLLTWMFCGLTVILFWLWIYKVIN